jgi:NADH-quinone oxidoreductase subunit I
MTAPYDGVEAPPAAPDGSATQPAPAAPPARSRGVITLVPEKCTSCMLCARECPDWCIHIEAHQETSPPDETHRRPRTENVLDRFAIDFSLCLYCGICIEVCPFDALHWAPAYDYPAATLTDLTHPTDRLASRAAGSR